MLPIGDAFPDEPPCPTVLALTLPRGSVCQWRAPLGIVTELVYLLLSCLHRRWTLSAHKVIDMSLSSSPTDGSAWHAINICWWMNVLEEDDLNSDLITDSDLGQNVSPLKIVTLFPLFKSIYYGRIVDLQTLCQLATPKCQLPLLQKSGDSRADRKIILIHLKTTQSFLSEIISLIN